MTGGWVACTADVRTRPDGVEVAPYLERALEALRKDRDIAEAVCRYDSRAHRVTIEVLLARALPPHLAALNAEAKAHKALSCVGICTSSRGASGTLPPVQIRLPRWPDWFRRN